MGVLKSVATRLEKIDDAAEAARDSLSSQAVLNIALSVAVCVAVFIAVVALGRSVRD